MADAIQFQLRLDDSQAQRTIENLRNLTRKDFQMNLNINSRPLGVISRQLSEFDKSLEAANARVLAFGATTGAIYGVQRAFTSMITDMIEVEKTLKNIKTILNTTDSDLQKFGNGIFDVANKTGQSFKIASDAALEFSRQGLGLEQTLKATEAALILTRISGLEASDAVSSLTSAVNTFTKAGLSHIDVVDKIVSVDLKFAVSAADLAEGLRRVGATAVDSKVSLDELNAAITSVQQVTARGGAVIGNAFKSIFTRLQRPKVQETLEGLGVQTKDSNGEFRNAISVLQDLARVYDRLSDAQKSVVSETVAGIYQVNTFKALLRTMSGGEMSLYNQALNESQNASSGAAKRNEELNQSLAALIERTKNAAIQFNAAFGQSGMQDGVKNLVNSINTAFKTLTNFTSRQGDFKNIGQFIGSTISQGIGNILSGPLPVMVAVLLSKTFTRVFGEKEGLFGAIKNIAGIQTLKERQLAIETQIEKVIANSTQKVLDELQATTSLTERQKIFNRELDITLAKQNQHAQLIRSLTGALFGEQRVQQLLGQGITSQATNRATGYIPNYAAGSGNAFLKESIAINNRVGGASKHARPVEQSIVMGGKHTKAVLNTDEYVVKNFMNGGDTAVFNREMISKVGKENLNRLGKVEKVHAASGYVPNYAFGYGSKSGLRFTSPEKLPKEIVSYLQQLSRDETLNALHQKVTSVDGSFKYNLPPIRITKTEKGTAGWAWPSDRLGGNDEKKRNQFLLNRILKGEGIPGSIGLSLQQLSLPSYRSSNYGKSTLAHEYGHLLNSKNIENLSNSSSVLSNNKEFKKILNESYSWTEGIKNLATKDLGKYLDNHLGTERFNEEGFAETVSLLFGSPLRFGTSPSHGRDVISSFRDTEIGDWVLNNSRLKDIHFAGGFIPNFGLGNQSPLSWRKVSRDYKQIFESLKGHELYNDFVNATTSSTRKKIIDSGFNISAAGDISGKYINSKKRGINELIQASKMFQKLQEGNLVKEKPTIAELASFISMSQDSLQQRKSYDLLVSSLVKDKSKGLAKRFTEEEVYKYIKEFEINKNRLPSRDELGIYAGMSKKYFHTTKYNVVEELLKKKRGYFSTDKFFDFANGYVPNFGMADGFRINSGSTRIDGKRNAFASISNPEKGILSGNKLHGSLSKRFLEYILPNRSRFSFDYDPRKNIFDLGRVDSMRKGDARKLFSNIVGLAKTRGSEIFNLTFTPQTRAFLDAEKAGASLEELGNALHPQLRYRYGLKEGDKALVKQKAGDLNYIQGGQKIEKKYTWNSYLKAIKNADRLNGIPMVRIGNFIDKPLANGYIPNYAHFSAKIIKGATGDLFTSALFNEKGRLYSQRQRDYTNTPYSTINTLSLPNSSSLSFINNKAAKELSVEFVESFHKGNARQLFKQIVGYAKKRNAVVTTGNLFPQHNSYFLKKESGASNEELAKALYPQLNYRRGLTKDTGNILATIKGKSKRYPYSWEKYVDLLSKVDMEGIAPKIDIFDLISKPLAKGYIPNYGRKSKVRYLTPEEILARKAERENIDELANNLLGGLNDPNYKFNPDNIDLRLFGINLETGPIDKFAISRKESKVVDYMNKRIAENRSIDFKDISAMNGVSNDEILEIIHKHKNLFSPKLIETLKTTTLKKGGYYSASGYIPNYAKNPSGFSKVLFDSLRKLDIKNLDSAYYNLNSLKEGSRDFTLPGLLNHLGVSQDLISENVRKSRAKFPIKDILGLSASKGLENLLYSGATISGETGLMKGKLEAGFSHPFFNNFRDIMASRGIREINYEIKKGQSSSIDYKSGSHSIYLDPSIYEGYSKYSNSAVHKDKGKEFSRLFYEDAMKKSIELLVKELSTKDINKSIFLMQAKNMANNRLAIDPFTRKNILGGNLSKVFTENHQDVNQYLINLIYELSNLTNIRGEHRNIGENFLKSGLGKTFLSLLGGNRNNDIPKFMFNGLDYSKGFIPNYASNPLNNAIQREISSLVIGGISPHVAAGSIRINKSSSLSSPQNPFGLAVTNSLQQPGGLSQAKSQHSSDIGRSMSRLAQGNIPNFARSRDQILQEEILNAIKSGRINPNSFEAKNYLRILANEKRIQAGDLGPSAGFGSTPAHQLRDLISKNNQGAFNTIETVARSGSTGPSGGPNPQVVSARKIQEDLKNKFYATLANQALGSIEELTKMAESVSLPSRLKDDFQRKMDRFAPALMTDPAIRAELKAEGKKYLPADIEARRSQKLKEEAETKATFQRQIEAKSEGDSKAGVLREQKRNERIAIQKANDEKRDLAQKAYKEIAERQASTVFGYGTKRDKTLKRILENTKFEYEGSSYKASDFLTKEEMDTSRKNIRKDQRDKSALKRQNAAFMASFLLPMAGAGIGNILAASAGGQDTQRGRNRMDLTNQASTGIATGMMIASMGGGPLTVAIGATVGVLATLDAALKTQRENYEVLQKEMEKTSAKFQETSQAAEQFTFASIELQDLIKSGTANSAEISFKAKQKSEAFGRIGDIQLRNDLLNANGDQVKIAQIQSDYRNKGNREISSKTLSADLEKTIQESSKFGRASLTQLGFSIDKPTQEMQDKLTKSLIDSMDLSKLKAEDLKSLTATKEVLGKKDTISGNSAYFDVLKKSGVLSNIRPKDLEKLDQFVSIKNKRGESEITSLGNLIAEDLLRKILDSQSLKEYSKAAEVAAKSTNNFTKSLEEYVSQAEFATKISNVKEINKNKVGVDFASKLFMANKDLFTPQATARTAYDLSLAQNKVQFEEAKRGINEELATKINDMVSKKIGSPELSNTKGLALIQEVKDNANNLTALQDIANKVENIGRTSEDTKTSKAAIESEQKLQSILTELKYNNDIAKNTLEVDLRIAREAEKQKGILQRQAFANNLFGKDRNTLAQDAANETRARDRFSFANRSESREKGKEVIRRYGRNSPQYAAFVNQEGQIDLEQAGIARQAIVDKINQGIGLIDDSEFAVRKDLAKNDKSFENKNTLTSEQQKKVDEEIKIRKDKNEKIKAPLKTEFREATRRELEEKIKTQQNSMFFVYNDLISKRLGSSTEIDVYKRDRDIISQGLAGNKPEVAIASLQKIRGNLIRKQNRMGGIGENDQRALDTVNRALKDMTDIQTQRAKIPQIVDEETNKLFSDKDNPSYEMLKAQYDVQKEIRNILIKSNAAQDVSIKSDILNEKVQGYNTYLAEGVQKESEFQGKKAELDNKNLQAQGKIDEIKSNKTDLLKDKKDREALIGSMENNLRLNSAMQDSIASFKNGMISKEELLSKIEENFTSQANNNSYFQNENLRSSIDKFKNSDQFTSLQSPTQSFVKGNEDRIAKEGGNAFATLERIYDEKTEVYKNKQTQIAELKKNLIIQNNKELAERQKSGEGWRDQIKTAQENVLGARGNLPLEEVPEEMWKTPEGKSKENPSKPILVPQTNVPKRPLTLNSLLSGLRETTGNYLDTANRGKGIFSNSTALLKAKGIYGDLDKFPALGENLNIINTRSDNLRFSSERARDNFSKLGVNSLFNDPNKDIMDYYANRGSGWMKGLQGDSNDLISRELLQGKLNQVVQSSNVPRSFKVGDVISTTEDGKRVTKEATEKDVEENNKARDAVFQEMNKKLQAIVDKSDVGKTQVDTKITINQQTTAKDDEELVKLITEAVSKAITEMENNKAKLQGKVAPK